MEQTIDGLTLAEVKYNIYAFGRDMKNFARKVERARLDHTRARWQKKYANAKGYLENNQERLARFEAVEQCLQQTAGGPPEIVVGFVNKMLEENNGGG